jgi:hypothetical protein
MTQKIEVYLPASIKKADARAMQALAIYAQGAVVPLPPGHPPPSPSDVKHVLDWIVNEVCRAGDIGFVMNDPNGRIGAFTDGRQYVAKQITMAMQLKPEILKE